MASSTTYTINVKSKGVKKANRDVKKLKSSMGGLNKAITGLVIGFGAYKLGGAIINLGKSSIKTAGEFEALRIRLNNMYGSVEKGGKAFETFNKIAATTPFQLKNVVQAGASLKMFGMDAEETIKPLSDLAAFMGEDVVYAASAMGRAFAGGVGAADVFREKGILQLIKDSQGIEDLTKLTIPEFRDVMIEALSDPSTGIVGATDALSKSWQGTVSNFQDGVDRMKAAIGAKLISKLQPLIEDINKELGDMGEIGWENIGESMVQNWKDIFKFVGLVAVEGGTLIGKSMLSGTKNALLTGWAESVGGTLTKLFGHKTHIKWLDDFFIDLFGGDGERRYETVIRKSNEALVDDFETAISKIKFEFSGLKDTLFEDAQTIKDELYDAPHDDPAFFAFDPQDYENWEGFQSKKVKTVKKVNKLIGREEDKAAAKGATTAREGVISAIRGQVMEATSGLIAKYLSTLPPYLSLPLAAGAGGLVNELITSIVNSLPNPSLKSFATGGSFVTNGAEPIMVGDNPSGRELVSVTPLDASGQPTSTAGGVNITFTGNVMSQDFIENEAIPQIRDAIRRGASLGVS